MKILLIQPPNYFNGNSRPPAIVPLGLGYIGKVLLNQGHDVEILDIWAHQWTNDEVLEQIQDLDYDIAGISAMSTQYAYVNWLILELKKRYSRKIVVGGALATFSPEIVLENTPADICVIGEGEITFKEICENVNDLSMVKGIYFKKNGTIIKNPSREYIKDLDTIEFPEYDLYPMDIYLKNCRVFSRPYTKALNMITARGCPYNCRFCSTTFQGVRLRSVDNIIQEIEFLMKKYKIEGIFFTDELLLSNKKRARELCEKIEPLNIKWNCQGRVNLVDMDLLKRMKKAGCVAVGYGVESGSQTILNNMDKRETVEQSEKALIMTIKAGLLPIVQMMYGYPGETKETLNETVEFFKKCPYMGHEAINIAVNFSPTTPLPGSELYNEAIEKGLIKDEHLYLTSLEGGYMPDGERPLVNFTEFDDKEFYQLMHETKKEILSIYKSMYPLRLRYDSSMKTIKEILPFTKEHGLINLIKRIKNKLSTSG